MKKLIIYLTFLNCLFGFSQSNQDIIKKYLEENIANGKILKNDLKDWELLSTGTSNTTKINSCYVQQKYKGITVFRAISNFSIKNGKVIHVGERYINNIEKKVNTTKPRIAILEAINKAYEYLNINPSKKIEIIEQKENTYKIIDNLNNSAPIVCELVYHITNDEKLNLAWNIFIDSPKNDHHWCLLIDAVSSDLLEKKDRTISCNFNLKEVNLTSPKNSFIEGLFKKSRKSIVESLQGIAYHVIPYQYESPNHFSRQFISNQENLTASPFGWHDDDGISGAEYTITRGNNVWAREDIAGDNETTIGASPDSASSLNFDFTYSGISNPQNSYTEAATTNLFYMNNILHDLWYNYGFNEENNTISVYKIAQKC